MAQRLWHDGPAPGSGCFAVNGHGDFSQHVRVQGDDDCGIAHRLDGAGRQADLRLVHFHAVLLFQLFGNVVVGDGAEQAAIDAN